MISDIDKKNKYLNGTSPVSSWKRTWKILKCQIKQLSRSTWRNFQVNKFCRCLESDASLIMSSHRKPRKQYIKKGTKKISSVGDLYFLRDQIVANIDSMDANFEKFCQDNFEKKYWFSNLYSNSYNGAIGTVIFHIITLTWMHGVS